MINRIKLFFVNLWTDIKASLRSVRRGSVDRTDQNR